MARAFPILISIQSLIISDIIARTIPRTAITGSSSSLVATASEMDRKGNAHRVKVCLRLAHYLVLGCLVTYRRIIMAWWQP